LISFSSFPLEERLGIPMSRKITVILKNGTELAYEDARVVEGNKTCIYQMNKNKHQEELLALIEPNHIRTVYTEED
jgi:endonuclease I